MDIVNSFIFLPILASVPTFPIPDELYVKHISLWTLNPMMVLLDNMHLQLPFQILLQSLLYSVTNTNSTCNQVQCCIDYTPSKFDSTIIRMSDASISMKQQSVRQAHLAVLSSPLELSRSGVPLQFVPIPKFKRKTGNGWLYKSCFKYMASVLASLHRVNWL